MENLRHDSSVFIDNCIVTDRIVERLYGTSLVESDLSDKVNVFDASRRVIVLSHQNAERINSFIVCLCRLEVDISIGVEAKERNRAGISQLRNELVRVRSTGICRVVGAQALDPQRLRVREVLVRKEVLHDLHSSLVHD